MIGIFLLSVILLLAVSSSGFALYTMLGQSPRNPYSAFFAGFFLLSLLAMAVSLIAPLNSIYSLLCLSPSLLGVKQLRYLFSPCSGRNHSQLRLLGIFFATAAACSLCAAHATWSGLAYDTDLYHIQIVRWLNEFGTPPGLGNLHSRLANSSTWPLFAALLNHSIIKDSVPWIMMPMFITAFTMYFIYDFLNSHYHFLRIYALCMFPVCIYSLILWGFPNLYHDFPSLALVCIVGAEFLFLSFSNKHGTINVTISILICIALSFLIKPLSIITVIFITPIAILYCNQHNDITVYTWAKILAFPLLAAALWCIRNIITSGYPFFPITAFPLQVDWVMQASDVASNATDVRAWARIPGPNYLLAFERGITFWLKPWVTAFINSKHAIPTISVPLIAGSVCWLFMRKELASFKALSLLCWPLLSLIYWFWMAPSLRFGRELFWLFFALGAACLVQYRPIPCIQAIDKFINSTTSLRYSCIVIVVFLMFVCSVVSLKVCVSLKVYFKRSLQDNSIAFFVPGTIQSLPVKLVTAQSGSAPFDVYTPIEGDRCGNAPLPCAPSVPQYIERRDAHNLGAGFRPMVQHP
ncbi:MAG: LIC_10190 family membrane protein [Desulfobulbus sp.]|jgi:hypothetical protein